VTATVGLGVNANIGGGVNAVVNNGADSLPYSITVAVPSGYASVTSLRDYWELSVDSPLSGEVPFVSLTTGSTLIYATVGGTVSFDGELIPTVNPLNASDVPVAAWMLDDESNYEADASITTLNLLAEVAPVDTTIPVISLTGATVINLVVGDTYNELGATAIDDTDGDITGSIVVDSSAVNTTAEGSYQVTYNVADAAGNNATQVTRTVTVATAPDITIPVISLIGATVINLVVGDTYNEQGATAIDDTDGDITGSIVVDSTAVNTTAEGSYQVTYNVADAVGNNATQVTRTVTVAALQTPLNIGMGFNPSSSQSCWIQVDTDWSKAEGC
jgi:5-hydroxyisourate hydrolase-like protein (transthyretin family)